MGTPHGGIRTAKKTKQLKKEDMHNKKRSRKVLSKQLLSMDFGLMAPPESESSDDDMFTGVFLEPLPDHFGLAGQNFPPVPLKGRRSGPKYQVSTERETLTTSEDDSSAAVNTRPYIRVTEPESGGKSGGETNKGFVPSADDKASFTVETEKAEKKEEKKEEQKEEQK